MISVPEVSNNSIFATTVYYSSGCNVENASYGLAICAERTAAVKAVSEGHKKFKACFVMANLEKSTAPCGACRQFLAEVSCIDIGLIA